MHDDSRSCIVHELRRPLRHTVHAFRVPVISHAVLEVHMITFKSVFLKVLKWTFRLNSAYFKLKLLRIICIINTCNCQFKIHS